MKLTPRTLMLGGCALLIAGCGLFGDDEEELLPQELVGFEATVEVRRIWSAKVGGESEYLRVGLRPSGDGSRIYAASRDGRVAAFDPESGDTLWRTDLETELSAGPGNGEGNVAVVTDDGRIVLLDAKDGSELWRSFIGAEALAHPLINDEVVIVQTIDHRLLALSRFDGRRKWQIEQSGPALTMRGAASPKLVGSLVVAGFDNGRLLGVDAREGDIAWESLLALPTGRSDLDRLSDIDGEIAVVGQDLYAAGYQGRVAAVAAESGQVLWQREISSHSGVAADWNRIYTAREDGEVISMSRSTGAESWRTDATLRRSPTLPVPFQGTVVVGDFEGYLHFFSNFDGTTAARVRFGKDAISGHPVVMANRLFVQSDNGSIAAFEIEGEEPARNAPDVAEDT